MVDTDTQLIPQRDPYQRITGKVGGNSFTIRRDFDQKIKGIIFDIRAQIDTGSTAPGRFADTPYDLVKNLKLTAGKTNIFLKPYVMRALHEVYERQSVVREDKPPVGTSLTNQLFGFTIYIPFPIVPDENGKQTAVIEGVLATASELDATGASNYSNLDNIDIEVVFVASSDAVPLESQEDEDSGSGNLSLEFDAGSDIVCLALTNEIETPSAPSAGNDETKYESTLQNIKFDTKNSSSPMQYDEILNFRILEILSAMQNNVSQRTGFHTLKPVTSVKLGANNIINMKTDGTATRSKAFILRKA